MKKFFSFHLPVWLVLLVIFGALIGMLSVFAVARPMVLNYSLSLPIPKEKSHLSLVYGEEEALSSPDFFRKTKEDFQKQKTSFIEADLSAMKLTVYKGGEVAGEFPILTKGKVGSWWETPAGIYKIATKEKSHFSSFGHVYQPWSMSFQGNFFIHGWPYYPDGTPVASTYSGGCIRLSDESAKAVYDLAIVGMPVLVYKEEFSPDSFVYQNSLPSMTTESYLLADIKNNYVFMQNKQTEKIPFVNFSPVLSSLVATDYINIERSIILNEDIFSGVQSDRLYLGEETTPFDLLHLSLRQSDLAPTRIFGNYLSEKRFISLMKDKTNALGMKNSRFTFSSSVDSTYTTPEDLFYLSKYIYNNRKFVFDITAGRRTNTSYAKSHFADVPNENIFFDNPAFVGGKVITNSNETKSFFGVFEISVKREIRPIFVYVGGSKNIREEVSSLLEYIKNLYKL